MIVAYQINDELQSLEMNEAHTPEKLYFLGGFFLPATVRRVLRRVLELVRVR